MRLNSIAARTALRAVQRELGEFVRVTPRIQSDYSEPSPDPDRRIVEVFVVVSLTPETAPLTVRGAARRSTLQRDFHSVRRPYGSILRSMKR